MNKKKEKPEVVAAHLLVNKSLNSLNVLNYNKINSALLKKHKIVIGFDTEFSGSKNEVYSYQFSFLDFQGQLIEIIYETKGKKDEFDLHKLLKFVEKMLLGYLPLTSDELSLYDLYFIAHYSPAEMSSIRHFFSDLKDNPLITLKTELDFGKYSTLTFTYDGFFKSISFYDTMNYQRTKLEKIGLSLGFPKLDLQTECEKVASFPIQEKVIENFKYYLNHPDTRAVCINYAKRDASICLLFTLSLTNVFFNDYGKVKIFDTVPEMTVAAYYEECKLLPTFNRELWEESLGHTKTLKFYPLKKQYIPCYEIHRRFEALGSEAYTGGRNQVYCIGIFKKFPTWDFDLLGAYTISLKLIRGLRFERNDDDSIRSCQSRKFSLADFKNYLESLTEEEQLTLQGVYSGQIRYDDSLFTTPTLCRVANGLAELKFDTNTHHIINLVYILKHPELVNWGQSRIDEIELFSTTKNYIFRDYLNELTTKRSKCPKGSVNNQIYKLMSVGFYGKTVQGITGELKKFVVLDDEETLVPPSRIYNPVYGSYITDLVKLLLFDVTHYEMKNHPERYVLNVITDGILINSKDEPNIEEWQNLPFSKAIMKIANLDILWQLKHKNPPGEICIKPRVDFPRLTDENRAFFESLTTKEWDNIKIAKPSAYDNRGDALKQLIELNNYFQHPDEEIPCWRLKGIKDLVKEDVVLNGVDEIKTINWNLPSNKMVAEIIDNDEFTGVRLKPFTFMAEQEENFHYLVHKRSKNHFIPTNLEQMKLLFLRQEETYKVYETKEQRSWSRFSRKYGIRNPILNDILFAIKKAHIKIGYGKTTLNEIGMSERQFKNLKQNCKKFNYSYSKPEMQKLLWDYLKYFGVLITNKIEFLKFCRELNINFQRNLNE